MKISDKHKQRLMKQANNRELNHDIQNPPGKSKKIKDKRRKFKT